GPRPRTGAADRDQRPRPQGRTRRRAAPVAALELLPGLQRHVRRQPHRLRVRLRPGVRAGAYHRHGLRLADLGHVTQTMREATDRLAVAAVAAPTLENAAATAARAATVHDWMRLFRPRQWVKNTFVL